MNNFKSKNMKRNFLKIENLFIIFIVFVIYALLLILFIQNQSTVSEPTSQLTNITHWNIDAENTTISSEVLWQASADFHNLPYWTAVGERTIGLAGASSQSLEVVDIETGHLLWTQDVQNVSGLTSILDGYIVTGQTGGQTIRYLNEGGELIWARDERLIRGFAIPFFSAQNLLYMPTNVGVYEYDSANGALLRVIDNDMIFLGAFDRYTLWLNQTSDELYLRVANNNNLYWHVNINNLNNNPIEFLGATNNAIVLSIGSEIIAYTDDAQLLWRMTANHRNVAVLNNGIIIFTNPQIQFFDIQTGMLQGEIYLQRDENKSNVGVVLDTISASENIIVITDGIAEEIITIEYDLASP